jgi:hypothetical protein
MALDSASVAPIPTLVAVIALYVTLKDRKAKLLLRPRKSGVYHPYRLQCTAKGQIAFVGGIEDYNLSSRSNAIRDYTFWRKDNVNAWHIMESQNYTEHAPEEEIFMNRNQTPLALAPFSGVEIRVMAFARLPQAYEMHVRIQIEDLLAIITRSRSRRQRRIANYFDETKLLGI